MDVLVKAEKGESAGETPGEQPTFHYPIDYVIRTWIEHKLHHIYPDAGGYNDQCKYLMEDWHTVNMYHIRVAKGELSAQIIDEEAIPLQDLRRD